MADFYAAVADGEHPRREEFLNILQFRSTLTSALRFDPRTNGAGCTGSLDLVRNRLKRQAGHGDEFHDCPSQLAGFVLPAVRHIAGNLRTAITRSYEMRPPHEAGELDAACIRNLSRRPGRTAVEKIQHAKEILTLRRTFTADTLENRLFKEFAVRFLSLLQVRERALHGMWPEQPSSPCSQIMHLLRGWLHSPEGASISPWRNEPPNNVLLADAHYNKIWIAYQKLSAMDAVAESEANDKSCVQRLASGAFLVTFLQHLWEDKGDIIHVSQCPLFIEYYNPRCIIQDVDIPVYVAKGGAVKRLLVSIANGCVYIDGSNVSRENAEQMAISKLHFMLARNYAIRVKKGEEGEKSPDTRPGREAAPAQNPPATGKREAQWDPSVLFNHRDTAKKDADKTVVFDLRYSCSYPRYSDGGGNAAPLWLVAQIWETEQGPQLLDCDGCTALQVPADGGQRIRTFSMKDVLGGESVPVEVLNLFARKIAAAAEGYRPVAILPDYVDDFTLADFRRALNLACPAVEYLPHSVALAYAGLLCLSPSGGESRQTWGYTVESVQQGVGYVSVVRARQKLDHELRKAFQETRGVIWELKPPRKHDPRNELTQSRRAFLEPDEIGTLAAHGVNIVLDDGKKNKVLRKGNAHAPRLQPKQGPLLLPANRCLANPGLPIPDIAKGALLWNACRRKFPDKVLWSVCLPPLSTHLFSAESARWVDYFFVGENAGSIIPSRGRACRVATSSNFKLARGQSRFAFPLKLGGRSIRYEAVLSLPQTLQKDLGGSFEVDYTYGDSQPYSMRFIPDSTGADSIPCAIRVADLRDDSKHVPPPFRKKSWEEFCSGIEVHEAQCTMCDAEKGYAYLIDDTGESYYCKREAVYDCKWPLEPGQKYLFTKTNQYRAKFVRRDYGEMESLSRCEKDRGYTAVINGMEYFCPDKANARSKDVGLYVHVLYKTAREIRIALCISESDEEIEHYLQSKRCYKAIYTGMRSCKFDDTHTCICDDDGGMEIGQACHISNLTCKVKCLSSSRDALYISDLYYLRRNIHDIDKLGEKCHALLRQRVDQITETPPENVASLAAWLFPVMNVNEQNAYADIILKAIPKHMELWAGNVVMAIGDAASDVQKKMLRRICGGLSDGRVDRDAYHVLARLMMRCDSLREWLSCEEVEMMLKNSVSFIKWQKENAVQRLDSTPFNALFCLLRYRESPDPEMRRLVASSAPSIQEMVLLVEQLQELLARQPIILHSSVHIPDSVEVPAGAHPLLYVLHHYLNSESGEMNITLQEEED